MPELTVFEKLFFSVANQLSFGDCAVGIAKKLSFTLTNHLKHDAVRFNWSTPEGITFSPCTGHLLPNCAKDVTAFFVSHKPIKIECQPVLCKVTKIKLPENERKVCWLTRLSRRLGLRTLTRLGYLGCTKVANSLQLAYIPNKKAKAMLISIKWSTPPKISQS